MRATAHPYVSSPQRPTRIAFDRAAETLAAEGLVTEIAGTRAEVADLGKQAALERDGRRPRHMPGEAARDSF
jgi:hypothetical protein